MRTTNSEFVIQGRTELTLGSGNTGATQFSAFAFGLPGTSVVEVFAEFYTLRP